MQKIKRRVLFFLVIMLGLFSPALGEDNSLSRLEKIVVAKNRKFFLEQYSLDSVDFVSLPYNSFIEGLSILPVDLQSRSPQDAIQTDYSLRGSSFQDVLILLNGERVNDPQTAHFNSDIPFTRADISRLQVLPAASSSMFGPDAIGGAINFVIRKPDEKKCILELSGGQYGSFSQLLSVSDKIRDLGVRLSVENEESGGFHEDTDYKKFTASAVSSLGLPLGSLDLNIGYQRKDFGAYDFYTPGQGYPSKERTRTYLLDAGLNLDKEGLIIKPNFIWRRHFDKFTLDKTGLRSNFVANHRNDTYTPSIYFQKDFLKLGKAGFGAEYGNERITSTTLGRHTREHKSIFIDDTLALAPQIYIDLSFRLDDYAGFKNVYTGAAALRYEINPANFLHCAVSRNMRVPSFTELYYSDPTTIGNSSLSAEESLNYEIGYEMKRKKLFSGLTLFLRREDDFIDWVRTDPSQPWQAQNIPGADVFGIEAKFEWEINRITSVNSNYTYINKSANKAGYLFKYGENYSRHLWNSELKLKLPFGSQSMGFTYKQKPGRSGWFLLNARANFRLNKDMSLFLSGTNLLNVGYQEIEGIPQPGRWVGSGFKLEW
ncbi:MAG: TonB-dependent receptor [Candidatus Omnitrophica bacterium]|nr:TonB-dependent receptor [Candidatus Omnitrophota bacterium]MDD5661764.1 TonB-dependent receptor [Candidatus Omnitrophota bacterium]